MWCLSNTVSASGDIVSAPKTLTKWVLWHEMMVVGRREVMPSTTQAKELLHQVSEAQGGVCMQICATRGGDYAVICGTGGHPTL